MARVRIEVDARSERLGRKVRDAKVRKVPYIAVVGEAEMQSGHVKVTNRADEQVDMPLEAFVDMLQVEIAERRR